MGPTTCTTKCCNRGGENKEDEVEIIDNTNYGSIDRKRNSKNSLTDVLPIVKCKLEIQHLSLNFCLDNHQDVENDHIKEMAVERESSVISNAYDSSPKKWIKTEFD